MKNKIFQSETCPGCARINWANVKRLECGWCGWSPRSKLNVKPLNLKRDFQRPKPIAVHMNGGDPSNAFMISPKMADSSRSIFDMMAVHGNCRTVAGTVSGRRFTVLVDFRHHGPQVNVEIVQRKIMELL